MDYQSRLMSVQESWQLLYDKACHRTLDEEHLSELRELYSRKEAIYRILFDNSGNTKKHWRELFTIHSQIDTLISDYGFPAVEALIYRSEDKIGLIDMLGNALTPPIYDDFSFAYDCFFFPNERNIIAKKEGRWGMIKSDGTILCPFDYDRIIRVPDTFDNFLLEKDGKVGIVDSEGSPVIPCEMDSICTPGFKAKPFFFSRNGKWGWYWDNDNPLYNSRQEPVYDEIFYMTESEWDKLDDEDEEFFEARLGEQVHYILEWSLK